MIGRLFFACCGLLGLLGIAGAAPAEVWRDAGTGMAFVRIPPGCYLMGGLRELRLHPRIDLITRLGFAGDLAADEKPRHEVCVDGFWLGQHEVRGAEWAAVMGGLPGARDGGLAKTGVSWREAQDFAARMSRERGLAVRLPSEAEWEYACRAGLADDEARGGEHEADLEAAKMPLGRTPEGQPPNPNAWGLHDMLGGVWEWVSDAYQAGSYAQHVLFNPQEDSGDTRVIRGGSRFSETIQLRCASTWPMPKMAGLTLPFFTCVTCTFTGASGPVRSAT